MTVRAALRQATGEAHDEVDAIFSRFDLARSEPYRRFLLAHASALLPIEAALEEAGASGVCADWHLRRRGNAILKDLEALGSDLPRPTAPPAFGTPAAVLGGIYVLEGSRLGGALLSRSLPPSAPRAFLAAPGDSLRWRKLLEDLERLLYRRDLVAAAVAAAVDVFACFAAAGRRELESASP